MAALLRLKVSAAASDAVSSITALSCAGAVFFAFAYCCFFGLGFVLVAVFCESCCWESCCLLAADGLADGLPVVIYYCYLMSPMSCAVIVICVAVVDSVC